MRSSPPLAAPDPIRRPHTWAHRALGLGGPGSASGPGPVTSDGATAPERGWASNAHEAGVPSGWSLGRNLRSKTRWFAGFCNSHHVSHFATFFIDARAEISVAESHHVFLCIGGQAARLGARHAASAISCSLASTRAVFGTRPTRPEGVKAEAGEPGGATPPRQHSITRATVVFRKPATMILPQVHLRKPCYDFSFL